MIASTWVEGLTDGCTAGLPGYWDQTNQGGHRYSWYRKSTHGHNTLTFGAWEGAASGTDALGATNQAPDVPANITLFKAGDTPADPHYAIVDLSPLYAAQGVKSVRRGFAFIDDFTQLLIVDEFDAPGLNVTWAMHTINATIAVKPRASPNPLTAQLKLGGKTLYMTAREAPSTGKIAFAAADVVLAPPQEPAPGLRKLRLTSTVATGRFVVGLSLDETPRAVQVRPLEEWAAHGPLNN